METVAMETESLQPKKRFNEFDDVFKFLNSFGLYQNILYWSISCLKIPMALQFGFLILAFGTPRFQCNTANVTCPINRCCENCTSYSFNKDFTSTVSEWNLICDRAHIGATIQSCFFAGMLIGSVVGGILSDAYGRKKCMFGNCFIMIVASFGSAFADSVILLSILRFVVGFSQIGLMVSQYTFIMELTGPNMRTFAGKATTLFWKIGGGMTVLFAYYLSYWRHLVIAGSLPGVLFLVLYKVFPESPRWLVAHGRLEEAHAILVKFKAKDKKPVDEELLRSTLESARKDQLERQSTNKKYHTLDMFKTPRLRRWSVIVCFNWFVISMLFFALLLFVSQLSGSIFFNMIAANLVDIPAIIISWVAIILFGRRLPIFVCLAIGSIICFSLPFIPKDHQTIVTALALIGKSSMGAAFGSIYLITSELYPTVIRNVAIGTGSMMARVGAILSPYFIMMAQLPGVSLVVPLCIFGSLAIAAALLALFLPETLFANMQQTIEATEEAQLDWSVPCCGKPSNKHRKDTLVDSTADQQELGVLVT